MSDLFRKGKSNFATTLVTGIGTGTVDTITFNSTTGLPTDTEIVLTFNRVTSDGTVNPTAVMERIQGTISGSTFTSYTRGVDGTTEQAHSAGTVVEYIPNAEDMNDLVDGILVGHNQDGTHKSGSVLTLPQINDTSSDHQYVVAVSELAADRTVTLPILTENDEFVFKDVAQTLTNKTLTSPVINTPTGDVATKTGTETLTNKTLTSPVINTPTVNCEAEIAVLGGVGFENSWVNYGNGFATATYYKDSFGVVHIKGFVKSGTVNTTIFTLPAGYRPSETLVFPSLNNDLATEIRINTNGNVTQSPVGTSSNTWLTLCGITFRV